VEQDTGNAYPSQLAALLARYPQGAPIPQAPNGPVMTTATPLRDEIPPGTMPTSREMAVQPVSRYINPATGEYSQEGVRESQSPMMNFDTGGIAAMSNPAAFRILPTLLGAAREMVPGEIDRVSTRIPTAKPAKGAEPLPDPHTVADMNINIDAARATPEAFNNNAMALRGSDYPDLPVRGMRNPDNIADKSIDHMADNLVWLHDRMVDQYGPEMVNRASQWYDGANRIALDLSGQTGLAPRQIAGGLAALSPQKNWFENVDLGKRLINIVGNKNNLSTTPQMNDWATNFVNNAVAKADTPSKQAAAAELQMSLNSMRKGQTLGEITDPDTRALFARAYDEAHNPRDVPIVNPEGDLNGDIMRNADGSPRRIAWGSFGEIKKALGALDGPDDLASISRLMGGNHKVRSFFNNIIAPNAPHADTTIDTHAIAAAHLRPLGSGDPVVSTGLGLSGSSSNATGSKGAYGLYHEAYRRAAERLGILPRQMQSIAWEGVRGLFSPEQKRNIPFVGQNADIWQGSGMVSMAPTRPVLPF
jgi:hypothetical protein